MSVSRDEARQLFAAGERDRLSFQLLVQTGRAPLDYPESLPAMLSISAAEFEYKPATYPWRATRRRA
jgi:hypothetical protein